MSAPLRRRARHIVSDSEGDVDVDPSSSSRPRKVARVSVSPTPEADDADTVLDVAEDELDELGEPYLSPARRRNKGKGKERARVSPSPQDGMRFEEAEEDEDADLDILDEVDSEEEEEVREQEEEAREEAEEVDEGIRPEYERDEDGYVKGSIVRMKLINFMTYDQVEFRPGPHLNMILGPNGTGKSSIAAALAVGLGFHPKVMGRAPDLKSYVKQGCEEAQTEVEIKGGRGKRNTILHCTFGRENDKTAWRINGETATKKAVTQAVHDFGVQANNLCCFLPQDKVSEFARLPPEGVLTETMRAAGDPRLSKWHKTLSERGLKRKEIAETLRKDTTERDRLNTLVEGMRGEVESFERRRELEIERQTLVTLLKVLESRQAGRDVADALKERQSLRRNRENLIKVRAPLMALQEKYQRDLEQAGDAVKKAERTRQRNSNNVQSFVSELREKEDKMDSVDARKKAIGQRLGRLERERAKYQQEKTKAQAILDEPEGNEREEYEALREQRREPAAKVREIGREIAEVEEGVHQTDRKVARAQSELDRLHQDHLKLSNIDKQREQQARRWDPSINFALDWLEKNEAQLFEAPVIRPACMSVNVKDKRLVKQLEACTSVSQRKTFLCTTERDFEQLLKLSKLHYPEYQDARGNRRPGGRMMMHFARITMDANSLNFNRPCNKDTALGFEGFAIDYLEAPDPMLAWLARSGVASTAITMRSSRQINDTAASQAGLMRWVCSDDVVTGTRSAYGRRDVQTMTRRANDPQSWNSTIDPAAVQEINEKMADVKRQKQELEAETAESNAKHAQLRKEMEKYTEDVKKIQAQIDELRAGNERRKAAQKDVQKYERLLAEDEAGRLKAERQGLNDKRRKNVKSQLPDLEKCYAGCEAAFASVDGLIQASMERVMVRENVDVIKEKTKEGQADLENAHRLLKAHEVEYSRLMRIQKDIGAEAKALIDTMSEEGQARMQDELDQGDLDTRDIAEVQGRLSDAENDLQLSEGINPDVVDKYKRYSSDLEDYQIRVEKGSDKLDAVQKDIVGIQKQFDPALDLLIRVVNEKFSQSFERVGCTGEVRLNRSSADFSQWGVEIAVSYRDGDELALLTASRQSGGERSLATITYLMSLTEMARTPFSLVDEINQGMDQRAERNVHNQLVQVTCSEHAGQYFLITPKLLTNLEYHPRMRVLNVVNGTHSSVKKRKLHWSDLKACIRAAKKSVAAGLITVN